MRASTRGRGVPSAPATGSGSTSSAAPAPANNTPTWADAVAATKPNGGATSSWDDDADALDTTAQPTLNDAPNFVADAPEADNSENKEQSKITSALQKVLPAKLAPKGSKMSWAQIARPAEPPKQTTPSSTETNDAKVAPGKESKQAPALSQSASPPQAKEAETKQPESTAPQAISTDEASHAGAEDVQPSAGNMAAVESTPSIAQDTEQSAVATARPGVGRSSQSQRQLQRSRQEAPVVMRGGNAQLDNLGMRFGSLNFQGGDQADNAPAAETEIAPAADANAAPVDPSQDASRFAPPEALQAAPARQDAFAQASTQAYPGKEGFAAQPAGFQQGLQQHQQAHQAAVAQAQASHHQQHADHGNQYHLSPGYGTQSQQPQAQSQPQSQPQTQPQQTSQYGDYAAMYGGLDGQRLSSYYGGYDQHTGLASRAGEEKAQVPQQSQNPAIQQQPSAPVSTDTTSTQSQLPLGTAGAGQQAAPQHHQQQQQQQQQFPNVMPYYYPHYYLPNQFQHYGQPTAGYGQYALYGGQPQHPSKPTTPGNLQSPYGQSAPHGSEVSSTPYGSTVSGHGTYGQSPASSALGSSAYSDYGRAGNVPNLGSANNDYSKLYGNSASSNANASSIPGLGGFLGQPSVGQSNGNAAGSQTKTQANTGLDSAYRQYEASKLTGTQGSAQQQRQSSVVGGNTAGAGNTSQQGMTPQQSPAQAQPQTQPQQYYQQQYNAYAGQGATGSYGNYPYRQYWGQ